MRKTSSGSRMDSDQNAGLPDAGQNVEPRGHGAIGPRASPCGRKMTTKNHVSSRLQLETHRNAATLPLGEGLIAAEKIRKGGRNADNKRHNAASRSGSGTPLAGQQLLSCACS